MAWILLLGGTSESAPLARLLQQAGFSVLLSTATDAPLELPEGVRRRWGRLDAHQLSALAAEIQAFAIVDAGHPFAVQLHACCLEAGLKSGIPCLRYVRPPGTHGEGSPILQPSLIKVKDHEAAAALAFSMGGPVFLTTGSRNLSVYVDYSRKCGNPLLARVLDHPDSLKACKDAGLDSMQTIAMRGPFTFEDNLKHLKQCQAKVMVTKASGDAGGLQAKLDAARKLGVQVVLIEAPTLSDDPQSPSFEHMDSLVAHLRDLYLNAVPGKPCPYQ